MSKKRSNKTLDIIVFAVLGLITLTAIITTIIMVIMKAQEGPIGPVPEPITTGGTPIYVTYDDIEEPPYENGDIFNTVPELVYAFPEFDPSGLDFNTNFYALAKITYDECNWSHYQINYTQKDYKFRVTVRYEDGCGSCASITEYFLIPIKRNLITREVPAHVDVTVDYVETSSRCHIDYPAEEKKPIIYFYPTHTTDISVKLGHPELITTSYPKYNNGWNITAEPSGKLTNRNTGRELYSLYWEGKNRKAKMHNDGFIVKGSDTASFLEDKLAILGLNPREAEEFIIYWLPILELNNYNYIRFETNAEINAYMPLEINPHPDTLIRVIMDYKALDAPIDVQEQKLTTPTRTGFTVVEWGGTEL